MKQYFSKITANHWCAKNKLHAEANEVAQDMERRLVTADELSGFRQELYGKIEDLNKKYARCNPLKIETFKHNDGDNSFYISGVFHLTMHFVKN
jgi:hypothetical protein